MPPLQIGPYRIIRPLSEGGMGVVYEAIQAHIERRVALKILLPQHATNHETLQRFFNEARAVNLIEHPSIVQISDYGQQPDGTAYLVMEYLRGEALSDRLDRTHGAGRRLPLEDALLITAQIAGALAAAHAKSVIHRDLKPSNVMLVKDPAIPRGERVKILDFGIAKLAHSQAKGTAPNAVVGTPQYMSPEQCRGAGSVDEKTDVYALGLILYEMIAGRPPFIAESAIEYIGQHAFREPPSLQSFVPNVFDDLATFVHSLLLKDKALRPPMQKAETELSRLLACLSNAPLPASNSTTDDEEQTRRYLPPPSSPATIVDPSRQALRPARNGQTLMATGVATAFALTIVAIVWGGYEYWSRRSTSRPATPEPQVSNTTVQKKTASGTPATYSAPVNQFPPSTEPQARPTVAAVLSSRPTPNVDEILQRAQTAHTNGEYRKVISLALPVAARRPTPAWRLIGNAACNLKDLKLANDAYRYLDASGKNYISMSCAKKDIQIVDGQFRLSRGIR